jgi:hypothetical protein
MNYRHAVEALAASLGFELIRQTKHQIWRHQLTGATVVASKTPRHSRYAIQKVERDMLRAISAHQ